MGDRLLDFMDDPTKATVDRRWRRCWRDTFLFPRYLVNRLPDFNQIYMDITLRHDEDLGFGDLDLIFKVTVELKLPNLSPKMLVCRIFHEPLGGF